MRIFSPRGVVGRDGLGERRLLVLRVLQAGRDEVGLALGALELLLRGGELGLRGGQARLGGLQVEHGLAELGVEALDGRLERLELLVRRACERASAAARWSSSSSAIAGAATGRDQHGEHTGDGGGERAVGAGSSTQTFV